MSEYVSGEKKTHQSVEKRRNGEHIVNVISVKEWVGASGVQAFCFVLFCGMCGFHVNMRRVKSDFICL